MSTNPARTLGPAFYASYWHALWIYFIGPPLGMLATAEVVLLARERKGPYCAKLHHHNDKRCIFRHSGARAPFRPTVLGRAVPSVPEVVESSADRKAIGKVSVCTGPFDP